MFARPSQSAVAAVVDCPICGKHVRSANINDHLDAGCSTHVVEEGNLISSNGSNGPDDGAKRPTPPPASPSLSQPSKRSASSFFQTPAAKRQQQAASTNGVNGAKTTTTPQNGGTFTIPMSTSQAGGGDGSRKRRFEEGPGQGSSPEADAENGGGREAPQAPQSAAAAAPSAKRSRTLKAAPLAERMRPRSLDEVCGQELVGPHGVLRALIEADRVPSMILWGSSGTGKTTIARCIAARAGCRFVEMSATSGGGGVAECKKLFQEAAHELALTGRKTILFCDEIHRFSKAQQDVFLKPVEAGTVTLIGATTENPSFRIANALLSRCRTFTLVPLAQADVERILVRAVREETGVDLEDKPADKPADKPGADDPSDNEKVPSPGFSPLIDRPLLAYLAAFSDGDARTALNLLELALSIAVQPPPPGAPPTTQADLKAALTKTLVYDRAGDQHYDTISAFHKSVRGSDPDATLYYLARMLQSGEDPLFIARRMVVIASEDVGLADASLLPLATAAYTAAQQIGMPEARIPLAHCAVALALAPKSTRAYRGLNNAFAALREPGVAALPIPVHLRNAPTRLMKELGYGKEYKYNPNYLNGRVRQDYLPDALLGRSFLEARDLGTAVDPDLE